MPDSDRNDKVSSGNCVTSVTKPNLSRHKLRCSGGKLYCQKSPKFSTKSGDDLNYHIAKKNTVQQDPKTITCVKNAALSFQVSTPSDTTNNVITEQNLAQVERRQGCKVLRKRR